MTLGEVIAAIDRRDLTEARAVFAKAECEPWREEISRTIEARITRAHEDGDYAFLDSVMSDDALPEVLRTHAANQRWLLDHRPAGRDHREFLRVHGARSIDDIDD